MSMSKIERSEKLIRKLVPKIKRKWRECTSCAPCSTIMREMRSEIIAAGIPEHDHWFFVMNNKPRLRAH